MKNNFLNGYFSTWIAIYIIETQQQQADLNASTTIKPDENDFIKTTQTQNRINNMRLNVTQNNSPFKALPTNDSIGFTNQLKFNFNFLYKSFILMNLVSKNKFHIEIDENKNEQDDDFNLMEVLFRNQCNSSRKVNDCFKLYDCVDDFKKHAATEIFDDNIEIDQVFYEKVEVKILEHARYLSNINSFGQY